MSHDFVRPATLAVGFGVFTFAVGTHTIVRPPPHYGPVFFSVCRFWSNVCGNRVVMIALTSCSMAVSNLFA